MTSPGDDAPAATEPAPDIGDDTTVGLGLDDDHTVPADRGLGLDDDHTVPADRGLGLDDDHTAPADRGLGLGDHRTVGVGSDPGLGDDRTIGVDSEQGLVDDRTAAAESEVVRLIRARAKAMRESPTPDTGRSPQARKPTRRSVPSSRTAGKSPAPAVRSTTSPAADTASAPVRTIRAESAEPAPQPGGQTRSGLHDVPAVSLAAGPAPLAGIAWQPGTAATPVESPVRNRRRSGLRNLIAAVLIVIVIVGLVAYWLVRP